MSAWLHDIRLAIRALVRDRGLSTLVVVTLALGIGFATALFSVVDGALLQPLPYADAGRLVYLWQNDRATGTDRENIGSADFYDFRDRTRSYTGVAMWGRYSGSLLRPPAEPLQLDMAVVHHDLDDVLGISPLIGRGISREETEGGGGQVIVLGHELWRAAFDGDRDVLGRTVVLDGVPTEIVGVLPADADVVMGGGVDAWRPLRMTEASATRDPHAYTAVARMAPRTPLADARAELTALAATLEDEEPANANRGAFVEPIDTYLRGDIRPMLWGLFGAVGILLALAVLNVTNLLLARGQARVRDAAVHTALGAGPAHTARRHLAYTLLLTLLAGGLGTLVAFAALGLMSGLAPAALLLLTEPTLNPRALAFTLAVAAGLGSFFGLAPAAGALRVDLRGALTSGGDDDKTRGRVLAGRRALVAGQGALAALLLVGAVLLALSLQNLNRVELGFETDQVLRMTVALPSNRYPADFERYPDLPERLGFTRETVGAIGRLPGVQAVALTTNHSLDAGFTNSIAIEGHPDDPLRGEPTTRMVTPGYFDVAGVRVLEGRVFTDADTHDRPGVVVLNQTAAERYFPGGDVLGSRISFWGLGFREIIGIVRDERLAGLRAAAPPAFYTSLLQTPTVGGALTFMVRTSGDPAEWAAPVRTAIEAVDPELAIYDVTTMDATLAAAQRRERFATSLLGTFAIMALILAGTGVYGVLSYAVARRRREMGIRLALGADAGRLKAMVVRQGAALVGGGLLVGLVAARVAARTLEGLLFGIDAGTLLPYALTGALLLAVALVAAYVPARRAGAVPPAESLRAD